MPSATTPGDPTPSSAYQHQHQHQQLEQGQQDGSQSPCQPERIHELKHDSSVLALAVND